MPTNEIDSEQNNSTKEVMFFEKQRFYRKKLWLIVLIVSFLLLTILGIAVYRTIIDRKLTGLSVFNDTDIALHFVFITIGALGLPYLFFSVRLETVITKHWLNAEFWPFKKIALKKLDIQTAEILNVDVLKGYNGFGIRENWNGHNLVVLADDTQAVKVVTKSGESYIFGTKFPNEFLKSII